MAEVSLVGGTGTRLWLHRDGQRFSPGSLPAGHYELWASFAGAAPIQAGYLSLRSGEQVQVACDAAFQQCRPGSRR